MIANSQAIEWVPLSELPTWKKKKGAKADNGKEKKYYMVAPFVGCVELKSGFIALTCADTSRTG